MFQGSAVASALVSDVLRAGGRLARLLHAVRTRSRSGQERVNSQNPEPRMERRTPCFHTHTHTHIHIHIHTHAHMDTHRDTNTRIWAPTHRHNTVMLTHGHSHKHTLKYMSTHQAYIHTHKSTHTHTNTMISCCFGVHPKC